MFGPDFTIINTDIFLTGGGKEHEFAFIMLTYVDDDGDVSREIIRKHFGLSYHHAFPIAEINRLFRKQQVRLGAIYVAHQKKFFIMSSQIANSISVIDNLNIISNTCRLSSCLIILISNV